MGQTKRENTMQLIIGIIVLLAFLGFIIYVLSNAVTN